jgi:uncharacterized membrane protein
MDKKKKSVTKSIIWRIMGVIVLAAVTFAYTRNWIQTSWITVLHHGAFLVIFYFHERFWFMIAKNWESKWKYILKMVTYETVLGNLVLGLITYIITGNVKQMTMITLTYIGIKHVMYFFNEIVWGKFKWGRDKK